MVETNQLLYLLGTIIVIVPFFVPYNISKIFGLTIEEAFQFGDK